MLEHAQKVALLSMSVLELCSLLAYRNVPIRACVRTGPHTFPPEGSYRCDNAYAAVIMVMSTTDSD